MSNGIEDRHISANALPTPAELRDMLDEGHHILCGFT
jgi:hypothetical protein